MSKFDFETEFMKIYPDMNKFSHRFHLQEFERKDLFHETVLKILEKRHMFKVNGEYNFIVFRGWCYRIMNNIFINNYRADKLHGVDSYDENPLLLFDNEPKIFSTDENLSLSEIRRVIVKTEKCAINRKMFFGWINGIPYESLAEIFQLPLGTVKSKLFYIRKRIQKALLEQGLKS